MHTRNETSQVFKSQLCITVNDFPRCQQEHSGTGSPDRYMLAKNGSSFLLGEISGQGALGNVYKARRFSDGAVFALKLPHGRASQRQLGQMRKETDILNQLHHENVVKLIESGETINGQPYMLMEYLVGKTLREHLRNIDPNRKETALRLCFQLCRALEYIHSKGIVHNDIKPDNIMICGEYGKERVVVLDFGISTSTGFTASPSYICGTPLYMSPEQLFGSATDFRSDVYQLGLVLFECLSGRLPFPISMETTAQFRCKETTIPAEMEIEFDPAVLDALKGSLEPNREERELTMGMFGDALQPLVIAA